MLSKTKKIALLTTGLVGVLVASSAVGVALSSCTTNSSSTEVEDNTKYNTYINWSDPNALTNLVVDESGLVYSDIYKTTIIAIVPSFTNTTITIPASVRAITGYTEVLPSGATIVRGAFQPSATYTPTSGTVQNGVTLNNLISTIKFAPNSKLKSIGAKAFYGCTLLESIDLPTTVTMIGDNAFNGCNLLKSISLTNVEYVGQYAFANVATSLMNAKIDISLNKAVVIGQYAFQNANISTVDFSANTSLISLGNYAFNGCTSLTGTINLSKATALTNTGEYTFQNCSGITAVNLPNSLVTIGQYVFNGCSSIANTIDLSGATRLSTIGNYAFQNCTKLVGLSYPTSAPITSFGENAFNGCSALTQLGTIANAFTAPAALTSIASNAFSGTKIAIVDISNMKVATPFQNSALAGMTSLTEVRFGTAITTLPQTLFAGDIALKSIKLPSSITSITAGTSINTNISTFYGSSLVTVDMSEITSYSTTTNMGTTVPAYLFNGVTTLNSVILKTGTTAIGQNAFAGTSGLSTVREASQTDTPGFVTAGTLTSIGDYAFQGTGLTSFTLSAITSNSGSDTSRATTFNLGQYAFADATKLVTVNLSASGLTSISQFAFNNATALTTINMPSAPANGGTFTINEGAFNGLTSLTSINLSEYSNLVIQTNNFNNATALAEINLTGLTSIPDFISNASVTTFKGISSNAVVQLSSAINSIANTNVFTKAVTPEGGTTTYSRVSLSYPNGVTFTSSGDSVQISSGVLSGVSSILNNVTGTLDLSSNTSLTSMGTNTLFGNTTITSLTLPAKNIVENTNLYTLATGLSAQTPSTPAESRTNTSQYTLANVPLGNNTALTSINFTNFNLTNNIVGAGGLNTETFKAITKIINSYAHYSSTSVREGEATDTVNFKTWDQTNNSWIQNDGTLTYNPSNSQPTNNGGTVNVDGTNIVAYNSTDTNTQITTLTFTNGSSVSYLLKHNNINWNLKYDATTQTITLTTDASTPANIYKGVVGTSSTNLQVYIKANSDETIDTTGVQINMTIKMIKAQSNN